MIKIKELRIGNIVLDNGEPVEIDRRYMVKLCDKWSNDLTPMPLKPELLEKCGFSNSGGWYIKNKIFIGINKGEFEVWFDANEEELVFFIRKIKDVHTLQNLYFTHCGEELEVNLQS